jgi:hypothetical protein
MDDNTPFLKALAAAGRSSEIPESADIYGWLVGSWELEVVHYATVDVSQQRIGGELHAGRVLEGRAIQDTWIMPRRSVRSDATARANNMYGTTLRVWDQALEAWRITWINPVRGHREEQIGRRVGNEIVQLGARADGTATRWRFTEISADSFRWLGDRLEKDGTSWTLEAEFRARRSRS